MPTEELRVTIARIAAHGAQVCEDEDGGDGGDGCDPMTLLPAELHGDRLVVREVQRVREANAARRRGA